LGVVGSASVVIVAVVVVGGMTGDVATSKRVVSSPSRLLVI